ncbi:hypothetical protein GBO14_00550 [Pseudoalteromonas shioyasakiensis]|uniref:hypothetical protein n=1 Tax=Pseudoalteromonas shioyasakiensis TaxID=1190813 RepID=UPI0020941ED9|nr:hypothetical protein [Pseudoalteromonas shioyasakiensis]MCO6353259.1 hypothetical protein [Pseudoalteromonas shioyasakiensis]
MLNFLHGKSHNVTADFTYINWHELMLKIENPINLGALTVKEAKAKSPVIAATDAPNKTKETILQHDNFTLIRLDLDDTKLDLESIADTLEGMAIHSYIIHSTASHQQGDKGNRYRIYIQLAASITYEVWALVESYLSYIFMADDCAKRPQQIMYLPVRLKGDTYEYKIGAGSAFDVCASQLLQKARAFLAEQQQQIEQASQIPIKPTYRTELLGKQVSIIDAVNSAYSWHELLLCYGYKAQGKAYLPPESTSKQAGAHILTSHTDGKERYYSHHESDPCATGLCIDKFDFMVMRSYQGDYKRALKQIAETYFPDLHKHNLKEYKIHKQNKRSQTLFMGAKL